MALDAKLQAYQAAGLALAAIDGIQPGANDSGVYGDATRIANFLGVRIIVQEATPSGRVILTTGIPPGDEGAMPEEQIVDQDVLRWADNAVSAARTPYISNVYEQVDTGKRSISLLIPVITDGRVSRIIRLVFDAGALAPWLADQNDESGSFIGIRDGAGRVVAASRMNDALAGRVAPSWSRDLRGGSGILSGMSLTGEEVLAAYHRLAVAPSWHVAAGRPISSVMSLVNSPVRYLLLPVLALLLFAILVLVALWLRRDSQSAALVEINRLLSDVPVILYLVRVFPDGTSRRRFLSQSSARLTGWPAADLARAGALMEKFDPAGLPALKEFFRNVLASGKWQVELAMRFADGSTHWMRLIGVCIAREAGGAGDVVGFMTDISEEKRMREELQRSEKFAILGEVAGRVSHELNQPMSAISMAAENGLLALERSPPRLDVVREKLTRIGQQIERVVSIITHISAFSRKETAAVIVPIDIAEVIQTALHIIEGKLAAASVSVDVVIGAEGRKPLGVAVLVEQIIINLVVNACDAYAEHAELIDRVVTIDANQRGAEFVIGIADHAGGIRADLIETLFDPFVTSKAPGKGTGLGLSFCLASVARMGGRITIKNIDGGARFEVALPIDNT